ncbi:hypothetical protein MVEN_02424600 [Mycena venus]|uniref:Uncharacterized protein n=1 Tax=Mycena venus TaxID=2733690 RepID=A0A8H7CC90_9AGAR|nr:hypothetical protein MVEN_02424600 [Mycena venus]
MHNPPSSTKMPRLHRDAQRIQPFTQLATLASQMGEVVFLPSGDRSIRQTDSLRMMNSNLNSLAIIATFLAGVQIQAISFSFDKNATSLQTTCNALFFGGLFVDVLSGTIAIAGAIQLQRTCTLLQQRESSLRNLTGALKNMPKERECDGLALVHHLRFLEMVIFPLLHNPRLWNELSSPLKQSADLLEDIMRELQLNNALPTGTIAYPLSDYRHTTNRLAKYVFRTGLGFTASLAVPFLILGGICCFTAGAVCLVVSSQPAQVWITSLAVVGGTVLFLIALLAFTMNLHLHAISLPFEDV